MSEFIEIKKIFQHESKTEIKTDTIRRDSIVSFRRWNRSDKDVGADTDITALYVLSSEEGVSSNKPHRIKIAEKMEDFRDRLGSVIGLPDNNG